MDSRVDRTATRPRRIARAWRWPSAPAAACGCAEESCDHRLGLLAQILRQVIKGSDRLARVARAFPAAERLVARPRARGRALRPIRVCDAGFDAFEEFRDVCVRTIDAGGEPEIRIVRAADAFVE